MEEKLKKKMECTTQKYSQETVNIYERDMQDGRKVSRKGNEIPIYLETIYFSSNYLHF